MSDAGPTAQELQQPESKTTLEQLKKMLDDYREQMQGARKESFTDRDYYDKFQRSQREIAVLMSRGQPDTIFNHIKRAVDGTLGVMQQGKTDPRAYMRNPPDKPQQPPMAGAPVQPPNGQPPMQGGAAVQPQQPELDAGDVASMTLRFIADTNHFDVLKMDVAEDGMIEGCGASIVEWADGDVLLTPISFDEFFFDPRSRKHNFSDARYLGTAKWMYADALSAIYPDKASDISGAADGASGGMSYDSSWDDRPDNNKPWVDIKQKRLMVAECYYREAGAWWKCVFIASAILEQSPSAYLDDKGRPACPIEGWSAYVTKQGGEQRHANWRYGIVRDMRDVQDEINARRSKAIHEINTRQLQYTDANAPPADVDDARAQASRPDGIIPPGLQVVPRNDVVANNIEMLTEAKAELERFGPNPAILGRQGADASGRAQQVRQAAGMTELARVFGRFADWEQRIYARMWSCARQFYTDPKWIRITNDEGAPRYVRVNEPQPPTIDPMSGQPVQQPPKNHIAQMDVDIVVESVPSTATLEQEVWSELVDLAKTFGPQMFPPKVLLQFAPIPQKRKVMDALESAQAEMAQMSQQTNQVAMAEKSAGIAKTQADAMKSAASIELTKAQAGLAEVQTVAAALTAHVQASSAAQLPPGYTLDSNGQHVPLQAPTPPPGATGVDGTQPPQG